MTRKISLTGIKPTGTPHIGNLLGAIHPALELAKTYDAMYFIADYHALTLVHNVEMLRRLTYEIAATWLACGLDPSTVLFYRQSDIPQLFELNWILACFTPKGLMNRAHAYKDAVAKNMARGALPDDGVNMGLFTYPIMMAADILMFNANVVPVGSDQKQHVEYARDIAQRFNDNYGEIFTLPEPVIQEATETVIGLDGQKMSKSYDNTIPIFCPRDELKKRVFQIVTNSQTVEEPKDPESCNLFAIYRLFATPEQTERMTERYRAGNLGWGTVKQELFELLDEGIAPAREKYEYYMANPQEVDKLLEQGGRIARERAKVMMEKVRRTTGKK